MRVMVIVKASESSEAGIMPDTELLTAMGQFNEELSRAGILLAGDGLKPSSAGMRVRFSGKDRTVINGPFAETKELIAGYWLWQVPSLEEAIAWVKRCPNPHPEVCEIEIRPVFEMEDFGGVMTPDLQEQEAGLRAKTLGLNTPRYESLGALRIAGVQQHYTAETVARIPNQWERFDPHIGKIPGQCGSACYGVVSNPRSQCEFDYLTGVELEANTPVPDGWGEVQMPPSRYVVFIHTGHVSQLPAMLQTIWSQWVPTSGIKVAQSPWFERYSADYQIGTGMGGMEVWIPLA